MFSHAEEISLKFGTSDKEKESANFKLKPLLLKSNVILLDYCLVLAKVPLLTYMMSDTIANSFQSDHLTTNLSILSTS